jgi:hypothetical protein
MKEFFLRVIFIILLFGPFSLFIDAKNRDLGGTPNWTAESNRAYAMFGYSVSSAGDVNGDGYSDVIVGATAYDNGRIHEGRAFVYHGSSSGLSDSADWTGMPDQADVRFGHSVSSAGDVNGDGYSDVIVGAYVYDNGEINEGRVFVYHGSSSGLSDSADWTAESNQENANLGKYVSSAGDVNGDGYSDVIVAAYNYDNGETDEGRVYVYHGSPSGLSDFADWTAESDQEYATFGYSVSSAGDVNNDGYSDVIVGAPSYDNGQTNEGRAFVYHGSASGLSDSAAWIVESNQENANLGYSVSSAGDVNGDGYSDVIVGAPYYTDGQTQEGCAFMYYGSSSGLSASPAWTAKSGIKYGYLGYSVSSAGDVNGDGYSDIILGTPTTYDNEHTNKGRASVYYGSSSGLSDSADWIAEIDQAEASFGRKVSYAGDVNNDGYSDVIVGAPYYTNGQTEEGCAFVYHGNLSGIEEHKDSIVNTQLSVSPSISTSIFAISFYASEEEISLKVYNKAGIMVKNLFTGKKPAGTHTITWNATDNLSKQLSSDVYFIVLRKEKGGRLIRKIILLR